MRASLNLIKGVRSDTTLRVCWRSWKTLKPSHKTARNLYTTKNKSTKDNHNTIRREIRFCTYMLYTYRCHTENFVVFSPLGTHKNNTHTLPVNCNHNGYNVQHSLIYQFQKLNNPLINQKIIWLFYKSCTYLGHCVTKMVMLEGYSHTSQLFQTIECMHVERSLKTADQVKSLKFCHQHTFIFKRRINLVKNNTHQELSMATSKPKSS